MINTVFMQKAEELKPVLNKQEVYVCGNKTPMNTKDEAVFDFGNHYVGYLELNLSCTGRHQDAPAMLQIQFAEIKNELEQDTDSYNGWIAGSWIQKETIHIDVLPAVVKLERRYAFRYVRIRVLSVSSNFSLVVNGLKATAVSSADESSLLPYRLNASNQKLDEVSVRTLHNCMQEVFEDGPKRDRRLWLGDLRLEALANYVTYRQNDLVKRCLYLFAGSTLEEGRLSSNIFLYPQPVCDDQTMFDYTLFFINIVWDYYQATQDLETLRDLEPVCTKQADLLSECFDENDIVDMKKAGNVFIDWNFTLDKQISAQGVYIYALRDLVRIRKELKLDTAEYEAEIDRKTAAAGILFDPHRKLFLSPDSKQVSYMSQIWMVLSDTVDKQTGREILKNVEMDPSAIRLNSPYAYHHYIQALINCGMKEEAFEKMHAYWGGMIEKGADTFWELYNPDHPDESPYGGIAVHSFCHAWSCTPAYFLRKYYTEDLQKSE